jgi:hypothetical protein
VRDCCESYGWIDFKICTLQSTCYNEWRWIDCRTGLSHTYEQKNELPLSARYPQTRAHMKNNRTTWTKVEVQSINNWLTAIDTRSTLGELGRCRSLHQACLCRAIESLKSNDSRINRRSTVEQPPINRRPTVDHPSINRRSSVDHPSIIRRSTAEEIGTKLH